MNSKLIFSIALLVILFHLGTVPAQEPVARGAAKFGVSPPLCSLKAAPEKFEGTAPEREMRRPGPRPRGKAQGLSKDPVVDDSLPAPNIPSPENDKPSAP
jgi:hypothetical protein